MASVSELTALSEDQLNRLAEEKGVNPKDYGSPEDLARALSNRVTPEEVASAAEGEGEGDGDEVNR